MLGPSPDTRGRPTASGSRLRQVPEADSGIAESASPMVSSWGVTLPSGVPQHAIVPDGQVRNLAEGHGSLPAAGRRDDAAGPDDYFAQLRPALLDPRLRQAAAPRPAAVWPSAANLDSLAEAPPVLHGRRAASLPPPALCALRMPATATECVPR